MSLAYSAIVRSLENRPEAATVRMAFANQSAGSAQVFATRRLSLRVGGKVGQMPVAVAARQQRFAERLEDAGLVPAEVIPEDQVERLARLRVFAIAPERVVHVPLGRDLVGGQPEEKRSSPSPASRAISIVAPSRVPTVRRRSS